MERMESRSSRKGMGSSSVHKWLLHIYHTTKVGKVFWVSVFTGYHVGFIFSISLSERRLRPGQLAQ